jgi:HEAT repeat protein
VEESVRLSSVEGLWEDETPGLVDLLVILLRSDPSSLVRAASATALGRFLLLGELEKVSRQRRDQAYSALMGALLTSPPGSIIYLNALEAVAYAANEEVDRLIRGAYASENPAMRMSAVIAMGRTSDRQYADMVRSELHNVLPTMRAEAARASGELEVAEAVPDLSKLIDDPDPAVVLAAIGALGQIGGDEARRTLEQAVKSDHEEFAEAAEEALAEDEFLHGDIKFSTLWFEELGGGEAGARDD